MGIRGSRVIRIFLRVSEFNSFVDRGEILLFIHGDNLMLCLVFILVLFVYLLARLGKLSFCGILLFIYDG